MLERRHVDEDVIIARIEHELIKAGDAKELGGYIRATEIALASNGNPTNHTPILDEARRKINQDEDFDAQTILELAKEIGKLMMKKDN